MRIVVAFLLLLNLLLFLWSQTMPDDRAVEPSAPSDVGTLRLWSEVANVGPPGKVGTDLSIEDDEGSALPTKAQGGTSSTGQPQPNQSQMPGGGAQLEVEAVSSPKGGSRSGKDEKAATTVGQGTSRTSTVQGEPAITWDEDTAHATFPAASKTASDDLVCGRFQWYADEEAANALIKQLANDNIRAKILQDPVEQRAGYWVLIPPQKDRSAALAKQAELKSVGVEDLWLFRKGPLMNSISLGLFTEKRRADRRAEEIRSLGFDVVVQPKLKTVERYAVAYHTDRRRVGSIRDRFVPDAPVEHQLTSCR